MPRKQSEAFVLRTRPFAEADLIVTFLTADEGKFHAIAKSAKKSQKRFGATLEPLSRVRATWFESERSDLFRLESCDLVRSYVAAQRDLRCFYLFSYIADVADAFAREREQDARFFRLIGAVLDAAAAGVAPRAVRRYFDLWVLRLQGILPGIGACGRCAVPFEEKAGAVVDLSEGMLVCVRCASGTGRPGGTPGDSTESVPAPITRMGERGMRVRLPGSALDAIRRALASPPAQSDFLAAGQDLAGLDEMARRTMLRFTERPLVTLPFLIEMEAVDR